MKIRALIAEDEPLARQTLRDFAAEIEWLTIVGEAADGRTAVDLIDVLQPELVFLDVQMPELSGLDVLNLTKHQPAVIFTTAFDRYAVEAFEREALDYLLKPFGRARFQASLERVHRRLTEQEKPDIQSLPNDEKELLTRIFVRSGNHVVPLKTEEVSRFEADDDYVKVFAGNRCFLINQTLGEIENRLDRSRFCRVHRSHLINLEFVEKLETQDRRLLIILKDKTEILASRSGSQELRKFIF